MKAPMISVRGVTKSYRKGKTRVAVLDDLSLTLESGQFLAVVGPSGSGKSTLLNLLGGVDRPDSGEISFEGRRIDSMSEGQLADWRARTIGFVFQFYNLIPILSAEQNVQVPLMLVKGLTRKQRRDKAAAALDLVGLSSRKGHLPSELSGGEQQRVAIARAIVADPPLLLCDEPTGDLDRAATEEVVGILSRLNREEGRTIVLVTHDDFVARHARQTLHLEKARALDTMAAA